MFSNIMITSKVLLFFSFQLVTGQVQLHSAAKYERTIFWVYVFLMVLPELLFLFVPAFRMFIYKSMHTKDNLPDINARRDFIQHYSSLMLMRLFMLMNLMMIIYKVIIPYNMYVLPFAGAMLIEFAILVKNFIRYKKGL